MKTFPHRSFLATALFNAANTFRDAGDARGAAKVLRDGLGGASPEAAALGLLEPANHHPIDGDHAVAATLRGDMVVAVNSLVVLDTHLLEGARPGTYEATRGPPWGPGVEAPPTLDEVFPLGGDRPGFHLVVQVYEPSDYLRRLDVALALGRNLCASRFERVHALVETDADGAFARAVARASPCAGTLVVAPLRRRLRFSDAFDYADEFLEGEVVVLANADIFFDDGSLLRLGDPRTLDLDRRVLALLRWEWTCAFDGDAVETLEDLNGLFYADGRPGADDCGLLRPRADSQDAWVFRAPLDGVDLPVELGRGKCDNHAAATFADAGYAVANPSLAVRPYHVQNCAKRANATAAPPKLRSYTSTTEVKGRVAYVPLSDAWLF